MITYIVGDLFQSPAQVLVNTVNTVGVMGKGIALDFKRIYPEMFQQYQGYCERNMFSVGQLWIYKTSHKWILNFPTKKHWRNKSQVKYIEAGLQKFIDTYDAKGINSISFPMLGCGNGELDWETQVRPIMEDYLSDLPIDTYIHLHEKNNPFAPEHRKIREIQAWLRGEPESLAFTEFWSDLKSLFALKMLQMDTLQDNIAFNAWFNPEEQTITIDSDLIHLVYHRDTFISLWQSVRSAGYCASTELPSDFIEEPKFIITLLSKLPYLYPILMTSRHHYSDRQVGLQLIPSLQLMQKQSEVIRPA